MMLGRLFLQVKSCEHQWANVCKKDFQNRCHKNSIIPKFPWEIPRAKLGSGSLRSSLIDREQGFSPQTFRIPLAIYCGYCLVAKSCLFLATPRTVTCQVPLSMEFFRQDYWNWVVLGCNTGLSFPSPGDLPDPGIELHWQVDSLPLSYQWSPAFHINTIFLFGLNILDRRGKGKKSKFGNDFP